jgi:hypothetical protein
MNYEFKVEHASHINIARIARESCDPVAMVSWSDYSGCQRALLVLTNAGARRTRAVGIATTYECSDDIDYITIGKQLYYVRSMSVSAAGIPIRSDCAAAGPCLYGTDGRWTYSVEERQSVVSVKACISVAHAIAAEIRRREKAMITVAVAGYDGSEPTL